jgi:hypothetical protein
VLALHFSPDLLSQGGRRIKRQPCGLGTGSLGQVAAPDFRFGRTPFNRNPVRLSE